MNKIRINRFLLSFFCFFLLLPAYSQRFNFSFSPWVDSMYSAMTTEQRIGQLIMAAAYSNPDQNNTNELIRQVRDNHIGGLIFFKGSPMRQVNMLNEIQNYSSLPLLIGIDAEWGLSMRLDSTVKFPRQMSVAAFDNDSIVYEMGKEIARQCRRMGIHVNFAPVVDINNNPNNPVINDRSWGDNKYAVAEKSLAYMRGMQENGVMACIKHYPGHGDTEMDSHLELPLIPFSQKRLDTLELFPFRYLIDSGAMSLMAAHLYVPIIDPKARQASSISMRAITYKLKDSLGFNGLVFTDALNMKGVSRYHKPGNLEVSALMAGNDVLLFPEDIPAAILQVKQALDSCLIDSNSFEISVKKILATKEMLAGRVFFPIDTSGLIEDLNGSTPLLLREELTKRQITLLKRTKKELPLVQKKGEKIACVAIGDIAFNPFQKMMANYGRFDYFGILREASVVEYDHLTSYLKQENYDRFVVSIHNTNRIKSRNYGLSLEAMILIRQISEHSPVTIVSFGIPYNLEFFGDYSNIVVAYQDIDLNAEKAAQAVMGAIDSKARLPVTVNNEFQMGSGFSYGDTSGALVYTIPETLGFSSKKFEEIDSLVISQIQGGAMPGCQVLVAHKGHVIYNKSFGHHTYDQERPVQNTDIYDLASVTKVAATTLAVMHLYEKGKIDLNKKASVYLRDLRKSNKSQITITELLTHTGGLRSWIPFYVNTLNDTSQEFYCNERDESYPLKVADDMFANEKMKNQIWEWIKDSELGIKGKYVYSDLGFYILQRIVEQISGMPLDEYVEKHFYSDLHLATLGFNPKGKFSDDRLIPTELDLVFRKQLVQGYVHDPGAAMMGGVAGHAGLFGNAGDLAVLLQMLVNGGEYAGKRFFSPETIELFSSMKVQNCRRGLGFDKPEPSRDQQTPCSRCASLSSIGHSGFTGTFIWADPEYELVYVFLSNRVYPDASNRKLISNNVRTNIQDIVYEIITGEICR